jgi:hypothetical protein
MRSIRWSRSVLPLITLGPSGRPVRPQYGAEAVRQLVDETGVDGLAGPRIRLVDRPDELGHRHGDIQVLRQLTASDAGASLPALQVPPTPLA